MTAVVVRTQLHGMAESTSAAMQQILVLVYVAENSGNSCFEAFNIIDDFSMHKL